MRLKCQRNKLWAVRELYQNDREKEILTGSSPKISHKVSFLSLRQQHHAVASLIDQASTKKSPPYQGKYIVIQLYSLFTFCLCHLAIVWPLWKSFSLLWPLMCHANLAPTLPAKFAARSSFSSFGLRPTSPMRDHHSYLPSTSGLRESIT